MKDYFPFFPDKGIIFLDTCAFTITAQERNFLKRVSGQPERYFEESIGRESVRFSRLTEKLSQISNWLTIKEVLEEIKDGLEDLKKLRQRVRSNRLLTVLTEAIPQREKTLRLLEQQVDEEINYNLLSQVEIIFQRARGKINERNTDCKLISAAFAYAEREPTYMFSEDGYVLKAYSIGSVELGLPLKGTFILDKERGGIVSSQQYWLDHCQKL